MELSVLCYVILKPWHDTEHLPTVKVLDDDTLLEVEVKQLSVHKVIIFVELSLEEIGLLCVVPCVADDVQLTLLSDSHSLSTHACLGIRGRSLV